MKIMSRIPWVVFGVAAMFLAEACGVSGASDEDQGNVGTAEQALSSDGPFTDTQALISYWRTASTNGAMTQIYLNGRKVYERPGFGPAFVKQYFDCLNSDVYAVCLSGFGDGYTDFDTLVSRCPTGAAIYKDGTLIRSGTNGTEVDISTCSGDSSFYGTIHYYMVIHYYNPFIPYGNTCYQ